MTMRHRRHGHGLDAHSGEQVRQRQIAFIHRPGKPLRGYAASPLTPTYIHLISTLYPLLRSRRAFNTCMFMELISMRAPEASALAILRLSRPRQDAFADDALTGMDTTA